MNELVTVRNKLTGGVARVPKRIAEHSKFGEHLEIVPDGTKPFVKIAKLAKPGKPEPRAKVKEQEEEVK